MTMTLTMTSPAIAPSEEAPAKPPRGSAQRTAMIALVLAVIF